MQCDWQKALSKWQIVQKNHRRGAKTQRPLCQPMAPLLDFSPTAKSFGVSAQIGSGVVRGGPEVRFTRVPQGSTRVPPGFHQGSTRFCEGCGVVRGGLRQGSTRFCKAGCSMRVPPRFYQRSTGLHQGSRFCKVRLGSSEVLQGLRGARSQHTTHQWHFAAASVFWSLVFGLLA